MVFRIVISILIMLISFSCRNTEQRASIEIYKRDDLIGKRVDSKYFVGDSVCIVFKSRLWGNYRNAILSMDSQAVLRCQLRDTFIGKVVNKLKISRAKSFIKGYEYFSYKTEILIISTNNNNQLYVGRKVKVGDTILMPNEMIPVIYKFPHDGASN